jgi:hypothetical protein
MGAIIGRHQQALPHNIFHWSSSLNDTGIVMLSGSVLSYSLIDEAVMLVRNHFVVVHLAGGFGTKRRGENIEADMIAFDTSLIIFQHSKG